MKVWNLTPIHNQYALIILNQPLTISLSDFTTLFTRASHVACADGGSNILYDIAHTLNQHDFNPHLICGDFDSIHTHVLSYYASVPSIKVIQSSCQDTTDFEKCLINLPSSIHTVIAVGAIGGRFDQTLSCLNVCCKYDRLFQQQIYLIDETNLTFTLSPGVHAIYGVGVGVVCGVVPLVKSVVTSVGLKWNLDSSEMEYGGLVSTSNQTVDDDLLVVVHQGFVCFTAARGILGTAVTATDK